MPKNTALVCPPRDLAAFFRAGVVAYIMPSDYAVMWTETGGLEGRIGFLCLGQNLIQASILQSNRLDLTE